MPHSALARHAARPSRLRRVLTGLLTALALLVVAGGASAAYVYQRLDGNIGIDDVGDRLGDRPEDVVVDGDSQPRTILVMGSDTREGNEQFGGDPAQYGGERSDTTILFHLAADRSWAVGVSIPRDSLVDIPSCTAEDGSTTDARESAQFNEAFALGGAACTIRTVEELTGIRVDNHVVVDFTGFIGMVDALGGVEVCLPEALEDEDAELDLPAGRREVGGEDALAYARARKSVGSDLNRIGNQQALMSAMVQRLTSAGTLANPVRLFNFLDEATRSITTDPELADLQELAGLGRSVQGLGADDVEFLTIPVVEAPSDPNRVVWSEPAASEVWDAIRLDRPVPGSRAAAERAAAEPAPEPSPSEPAEPLLEVAPDDVDVRVLNGSGVPGAASGVGEGLEEAGFTLAGLGNAEEAVRATEVHHAPGSAEAARTLAEALGGAPVEADPDLGDALEVVVGPDVPEVRTPAPERFAEGVRVAAPTSSPTATPEIEVRGAEEDICGQA